MFKFFYLNYLSFLFLSNFNVNVIGFSFSINLENFKIKLKNIQIQTINNLKYSTQSVFGLDDINIQFENINIKLNELNNKTLTIEELYNKMDY